MLVDSMVLQVQELLDQGNISNRNIAKRLGVSRGTVGNIASGERGLSGGGGDTTLQALEWSSREDYERCPDCGGLVLMPCELCKAVEASKDSNLAIVPPDELDDLMDMMFASGLASENWDDQAFSFRLTIVE